MIPAPAVEPLNASHDRSRFDCGNHTLDYWLRKHAHPAGEQDETRTFVMVREGRVVAYHTLVFGSVDRAAAPSWAQDGPPFPMPVLLLARLAVDRSEQRHGLGKLLVRDALDRCLNAAEAGGLRAMLVHALDDEAARFYARMGFRPSPVPELRLHLFLPLAEIRRARAEA